MKARSTQFRIHLYELKREEKRLDQKKFMDTILTESSRKKRKKRKRDRVRLGLKLDLDNGLVKVLEI